MSPFTSLIARSYKTWLMTPGQKRVESVRRVSKVEKIFGISQFWALNERERATEDEIGDSEITCGKWCESIGDWRRSGKQKERENFFQRQTEAQQNEPFVIRPRTDLISLGPTHLAVLLAGASVVSNRTTMKFVLHVNMHRLTRSGLSIWRPTFKMVATNGTTSLQAQRCCQQVSSRRLSSSVDSSR